jgi:hypothetical protein
VKRRAKPASRGTETHSLVRRREHAQSEPFVASALYIATRIQPACEGAGFLKADYPAHGLQVRRLLPICSLTRSFTRPCPHDSRERVGRLWASLSSRPRR